MKIKRLLSAAFAVPALLLAALNFFTLRDAANGEVVLNTGKLFALLFQNDASQYVKYIDVMTADLLKKAVIALLVSFAFFFAFIIVDLAFLTKRFKATAIISEVAAIGGFANYVAAFGIVVLLYNSGHPCFIVSGVGGPAAGAYIALVLFAVCVSLQIIAASGVLSELSGEEKAALHEMQELSGQLGMYHDRLQAVGRQKRRWKQDQARKARLKQKQQQAAAERRKRKLYVADAGRNRQIVKEEARTDVYTQTSMREQTSTRAQGLSQTRCDIVFVTGQYRQRRFQIRDGQVIYFGKDPRCCSIIFDEKYSVISRRHCAVKREGDKFYIADYSTNGLYNEDGSHLHCREEFIPFPIRKVVRIARTDNTFYCTDHS